MWTVSRWRARGTFLLALLLVTMLGSCLMLGSCTMQAPYRASPDALPFDWALRGDGVSVEVQSEPFGYRIRDHRGTVVLSTLSDSAAGGFSPVAFTHGKVRYEPLVSPGYTAISAELEPWRSSFEVEDVEVSAEELRLLLRHETAEDEAEHESSLLRLVFRVRRSAVRVSAELVSGFPRAWSVGFSTPDDEAFLGFGERFNRTNQRGLRVPNWSEEGGVGAGESTQAGATNPWPHGETMTYYPVPFFVSSQGYGFWLDTAYFSEFDLAASRADAWRVWHVGKRLDYEVFLPSKLDERPWPLQVIDGFTERTGRPMLPPAWAFGPRRRVSHRSMQNDVAEIQAMRDEDLPVTAVDDAVHFFPSASHQGREARLRQWTEDAARLGYRVNGYYNSFVSRNADSPLHEMARIGARQGFFLARPDGSFPNLWIFTGRRIVPSYLIDFSHPEARRWYQSTFSWANQLGYAGWMYDFGEYVPVDVVAANGMTGEELHNRYPVEYARAVHEAMEASPRKGDWLAFMRSGYTGSSAYVPMVWAGDPAASFEDADGLPSMVRAGVNLGISGAPHWGGDIGGYHCIADGPRVADEELLIRWIQQGALTPNMQEQDACVGVPRRRKKASLWSSTRARDAWRTYARLHTRLFPYLYTLAMEAARTGAPLMRHPFLEHPEEKRLRSVDDAYYLGPSLFVAPVVQRGAREKRIELPDDWYLNWNTHQMIQGGQLVELEAPLDQLPLLLRAGSVIPMLDASIDTLAEEQNPDVVGPGDVADVYDVVAFVRPGQPARILLHDGTRLRVRWNGHLTKERLGTPAPDEAALRSCTACYQIDSPQPNLLRVRFSQSSASLQAGGLTTQALTQRRIRWDLFLALD